MIADDFYADPVIPGERRLMLAVLLTAIMDAAGENTGTTTRRERDLVRGTALGWIRDGGEDFETVCDLAGVEPRQVRRAAFDFIAGDKEIPRTKRMSAAGMDARNEKRRARNHA